MIKSILTTMILFYVFVYWLGFLLAEWIFPGSGVLESYFKPIYLMMHVLSGLIVGCTYYLAKLIKGLSQTNVTSSVNKDDVKEVSEQED